MKIGKDKNNEKAPSQREQRRQGQRLHPLDYITHGCKKVRLVKCDELVRDHRKGEQKDVAKHYTDSGNS